MSGGPALPPDLAIREDVPLAPFTTLELGGRARLFLDATDGDSVWRAVRWADEMGVPLAVLGGGSNVVVADEGFDGLVIRVGIRGMAITTRDEHHAHLTSAAGEPFDALVSHAVAEGLGGLECMSGIPGLVGATPVQNVGAYGQEVAETIESVRVIDRATASTYTIPATGCGFAYRDSRFKREPGRFVVLAVVFRLPRHGGPCVRHEQVARALAAAERRDLATVREAVLSLRREKSMVLDPSDPNRRSVGSFFMNPLVTKDAAARVASRALELDLVRSEDEMPRFLGGPGMVKLSAAWLIEHAGVSRGLRQGNVGVSTRHVLALVHHGGGSAAELLALAAYVQRRVSDTFGVTLTPEPARIGHCV